MPSTTRPLLAVRLIGPAETVAAHRRYLLAYFTESFGTGAVCRTSTYPAGRIGEVRAYLTITPKEKPPR